MTETEIAYSKMLNGELYTFTDEMGKDQAVRLRMVNQYNATDPDESDKRQQLLKEMFAEIGEGCYIEPPFHANWGGKYVHLGSHVYANFNLTLVDDCDIYVGDHVMFGPNVTITAANHPIAPELRDLTYQYNLPVHIGSHVWLGVNVTVLPGVTIGDGCVIGAGSVVTKDMPEGNVCVGNPCRILRPIGERDYIYYKKELKIKPEDLAAIGRVSADTDK